jgi:hypothetical protein
MQEGVDGLLHDKTRPPGRKPLDVAVVERVVFLTARDPPAETTHWTAGMMAKAVGISVRCCTADLVGAWAAAAGAPVQTLPRPGIRLQTARDRWSLCQPAATRPRDLGR